MGEFVRVERDGAIATIRLDRPKMNALNAQVQDEIAGAAAEVDADPGVRAVVLYGGERVFAAGADIKEMAEASFAQVALDSRRLQAAFWSWRFAPTSESTARVHSCASPRSHSASCPGPAVPSSCTE